MNALNRLWAAVRQRRRGIGIVTAFALMPLVLLAILVVSAVPDDHVVQVILLAIVTALWLLLFLIVRLPEDADDDYQALTRWIRERPRVWAVPAVFALVIALFAFELVRESMPGQSWTGFAVRASLLLWPFAVLLYQTRRFVSRAWRGVSWGLAVFAAIVAVVIPIAVIWIMDAQGWFISWRLLLIVVAAPTVVVFLALYVVRADHIERAVPTQLASKAKRSRTLESDAKARERPRGSLALVSIGCAVLSSLLLLGSAIRVPIERRLVESSQVAEKGAAVGGVAFAAADRPTASERRAVLERYSPVLRLHESEGWMAYDASSKPIAAIAETERPEGCTDADGPCAEIALERALATLGDARPPRARVFGSGAVYPRLVDVRDEVRAVGEEVPDFARTTEWLAQYWLFYPNNEWKAESAIGPLVQSHGGDWEWVGVGLDATAAPVFVAYSAHCSGTWRPWKQSASVAVADRSRVTVGGDRENPASHPLTIVALGSHANYPTPGTREPDWGSCQFGRGLTAQAIRWVTFIAAAREETPDLGSFQVPTLLDESDTQRDARRPVWWGAEGHTRFGPVEIAVEDHGPASPFYQPSWQRPIETIFGWECDLGGRSCNPR